MKIYDCFMFFNEVDLLEIRLNELYEVVDEFLIVEGTVTTTGMPKPLYFIKERERFKKFLPKITYPVLSDHPKGDNKNWSREVFARNMLKTILQSTDIKDTDSVIMSDLDEIPRADAVMKYRPEMGLRCLEQKHYCYFLNCYRSAWHRARIIGWNDLKTTTPFQIRDDKCPNLEGDGGWHYSFQGGADMIIDKIKAYTHSEYNRPEIVNKEWIEYAINVPVDILKRKDFNLKFVPLDAPKYVMENRDKFKSMIKEI